MGRVGVEEKLWGRGGVGRRERDVVVLVKDWGGGKECVIAVAMGDTAKYMVRENKITRLFGSEKAVNKKRMERTTKEMILEMGVNKKKMENTTKEMIMYDKFRS